jgi:pilus assembly protein CpaF
MANTPTTAARQEMKTAVHRALIERVDLEKIGVIKGNRSGQFVLLEAIHKLINEQGVPLTVPER